MINFILFIVGAILGPFINAQILIPIIYCFPRALYLFFKGELKLIGKLVDVQISKAYLHSFRGKIIKEVGNVN